ncbi:MAG TPA: hypothetical protein PK681_12580 [Steroidobacteraceae bacterium]|nr:hypothetical protein [Steroidobacteraceae bacterium]HQW09681.1 hypothetical protein [Steroidobacteraceae bacterium]HQX46836.1 hypothetical protein [Steroidobacteraceae bacterium]HQX79971.1 hypothetical protein [Steroidobacteraceae bacterium]HQZ81442.1 hypothetical protein [Steroidobacteraceae bacterium]
MNDTSEEVAAMVAARHAAMSVEERVRAASSMYDAARGIVEASIPRSVQGVERRYQVLKRFYGDEVPDAALRACAASALVLLS